MKKRIYIITLVVLLSFFGINNRISGQTKNFDMLKLLEIQSNILQSLAVDFVDTLNFEKAIKVGINAMLESLDPYTEFVPAENKEDIEMLTTSSYGGVGALIRKIDSLGVMIIQPYPNSPAVKFGLEPSDIILKIDGVDVKSLSADECSARMRGAPDTKVKLFVRKGRSGKEEEIEVIRGKVHTSDVSYFGLLNDEEGRVTQDGYIMISGFTLKGADDVRKAVVELKNMGAKRIVLDLRGNGGGLIDEAVDIVSIFVPKGTLVVSAKGKGASSNFSYSTTKEPVDTEIPVMVMVNSASASSSEIVAGAIQDLDRGVIMGVKTFGKGLVQTFRSIGYDAKLKLTISKYYTPSGRCIQIMDYSHRNEDGSVGAVPDSLKKPFKTLKGRTVYDGGGITPDTTIEPVVYSRPVTALILGGLLDEYAVEYYKKNKKIASAEEFSLTDKEYMEFVKYVASKDFDSRTGEEILFDHLIKQAKESGNYEKNKNEYEALSKKIILSKEQVLIDNKNEIKGALESEIVSKYYYTYGRVKSQLKSDTQLFNAIKAWQ